MLEGYTIARGIIRQTKITAEVRYDLDYVRSRYDTYSTTRAMSELRFRLLNEMTHVTPGKKVLDIGYGNGDFLAVCQNASLQSFGHDISGYPLPPGAVFVSDIFAKHYHCITFFDSLEHMSEIDFISELQTTYIVISLPWCHYLNDKWFEDWKHRRPNEHIFHFGHVAICEFMRDHGFRTEYIGNPEDQIRTSGDHLPNILTGVFSKR